MMTHGLRPIVPNRIVAAELARLHKSNAALREALNEFLRVWIELVESGDAGFWDPEKDDVVIQARQALADHAERGE